VLEGIAGAGPGAETALQVAFAVALLMLGRRLYWLFVAAVGFVVAMELASVYFEGSDGWIPLALAAAAGIAGALFAVILQRFAVALAGFAVAAYFAAELIGFFSFDQRVEIVAVLVVGALGAFFASVLFDWALILLSSLAGAALFVDAFALEQELALLVMLVLAIAGVSIQANMLHRDKDD
jgi:hypothetical protein